MKHFITFILLAISLVFFGGQHFWAQEQGGNIIMSRPVGTMEKNIPPMDINVPAVTETATFALG